jgi:hypothetical protein
MAKSTGNAKETTIVVSTEAPDLRNLWLRQTYITPSEVRTYWLARDLKVKSHLLYVGIQKSWIIPKLSGLLKLEPHHGKIR